MKEFFHVTLLAYWVAFILPAGILATIFVPGLVWVWIAANVVVAYYFNKTRKHGEPEAYDDKLSTARITDAVDRWVLLQGVKSTVKDREQ